MPRPKRWCQTRLTSTRALSGLMAGSTICRASSSRPLPRLGARGRGPARASRRRCGTRSPWELAARRGRTPAHRRRCRRASPPPGATPLGCVSQSSPPRRGARPPFRSSAFASPSRSGCRSSQVAKRATSGAESAVPPSPAVSRRARSPKEPRVSGRQRFGGAGLDPAIPRGLGPAGRLRRAPDRLAPPGPRRNPTPARP